MGDSIGIRRLQMNTNDVGQVNAEDVKLSGSNLSSHGSDLSKTKTTALRSGDMLTRTVRVALMLGHWG